MFIMLIDGWNPTHATCTFQGMVDPIALPRLDVPLVDLPLEAKKMRLIT
jgi:hypothetical protein